MFNDLKSAFKETFDYIPMIMFIGLISGIGSYNALVGTFIISLIFCLFKVRLPLICAPTIPFALALTCGNTVLGGKNETLCTILFAAGIFSLLFIFLKNCKNLMLNIPKCVSSGFLSSIFIQGAVLSLSLILGNKILSSVLFIPHIKGDFFAQCFEGGIVLAILYGVIYYYLRKIHIPLPFIFFSAVIAGFINYFYKLDPNMANYGLSSFKFILDWNLLQDFQIIFISFFLSILLVVATLNSTKNKSKENKNILLVGFSNIISSLFGTIAGTIQSIKTSPDKKDNKYVILFNTLFILLLVLNFNNIIRFIPLSLIGAVCFLECLRFLKVHFFIFKKQNLKSKIIFVSCFLSCLYNVILGIAVGFIFTLWTRTKENDKNN